MTRAERKGMDGTSQDQKIPATRLRVFHREEAKRRNRETTRLRRSRYAVTAERRGRIFLPLSDSICRARMHAQTAY